MDRFCSRGYPVTPVVVAVFDDADRVRGSTFGGADEGREAPMEREIRFLLIDTCSSRRTVDVLFAYSTL